MRHTVVTTFNGDGYRRYARRFLESFERRWDRKIQLIAYVEDLTPPSPISDRIAYRPLPPACAAFKERFSSGEARGLTGDRYDFRFDAIRFCHKVYAVTDAGLSAETGRLYWLDADVATHAEVTPAFLEGLLPAPAYCAYLGRHRTHTETGFLAFDVEHPQHGPFMSVFRGTYASGAVFQLPQWTDSFVFDVVRKGFEAEGLIKSHNLGADVRHSHVFVNSPLGAVMDHLKGPARKHDGHSSSADLARPRSEPYWDQVKAGARASRRANARG